MTSIYFVERRLNKARIKHLKLLAEKSTLFNVCDEWQKSTYLLISESTADEAMEYLMKGNEDSSKIVNDLEQKQFLDISWFHECIKIKKVLNNDSFKETLKNLSGTSTNSNFGIFCKHQSSTSSEDESPIKKVCYSAPNLFKSVKYACQTAASLEHFNKKFCDALEILEIHALYRGDKNSEARALAFRRGSASLKAFHKEISCESDIANINFIGQSNSSKAGHCKKVVLQILSQGFCDEVESVVHSNFYQVMNCFCGIFGVGPATSRKWYHDLQLRSLEDLKAANVTLTQDQVHGIEHYQDLNTPVTFEEAEYILKLVEKTCKLFDTSLTVTLAGGFRRGKTEGHDVDLLISQTLNENGKNVLANIIEHLHDHFFYTNKRMTNSSNQKDSLKEGVLVYSTMDNFDKCFSIFKFDNSWLNKSLENGKSYKAIRLDLVVVPSDQFSFALLGWSGSKHFEREIRRYARAEKQIVLTSHGMFNIDMKKSISASSEEEIFQKLELEYRKPCERCF